MEPNLFVLKIKRGEGGGIKGNIIGTNVIQGAQKILPAIKSLLRNKYL